MILIAALALLTAQAPASAALKIVVLQGEGAVNIIQQKTAVAPLVEVRDRNNLPVSGAVVTFSLGGPGASFGGASTLAVTTNAAGQAVATGFTPTAAGAIHINAIAAFQGQTAAAAITQTNVMTAAEAAAASGASSASGASGAAGGAGGGLSVTTIGIVGGAVAGGVVAAEQLGVIGGSPQYAASSVTIEIQTVSVSTQNGRVIQNCTMIWTFTAPMKMEVDASGDSVSGRFELKGTSRATGGTCPLPPTNAEEEGFEGPVGGTTGNITFTKDKAWVGTGGANNLHVVSFIGALSGDQITGKVTFDWKMSGQVRMPATTFDSNGSGSTTVTLTKQ